ncbi:response regulator transcription factor [Streptomyces sp. AC627_RSS907]|uniref:response regulator transcription factor n=1 Tax=Streptomyces sp. AC627_RSS907 TaxID=2823684 RepID=UPI001C276D35|nr:response regulator transcription factor [Streptomyces sp. AC627_RSS907]
MRVLVVEDEVFLAEMIAEGLRRDALAVDVALDGVEALRRLRFVPYDAKPFAYAELLARVLALGRRVLPAAPPLLERAGVALDTARRTAHRDGQPLPLSRKEFGVLESLMRANGAPVSVEDLIEQVWDEHIGYGSTAVRVTMSKLRANLGDPPAVVTVPGVGYGMAGPC